MGEWKKTHAIRWGEEYDRKLSELKDVFAPHCRTLTDVVLSSIDVLHSLFTMGILQRMGNPLQRLQRITLHYADGQNEVIDMPAALSAKPGPLKMAAPVVLPIAAGENAVEPAIRRRVAL